MNQSPKISESELEIMRIIWEHDAPMTVTQIRTEAEQRLNWEPSTIKTLLSRLLQKGAVSRIQEEGKRVYYYAALISKEDYGQESADKLIDKIFKGSAKNLVASLLSSNKLTKSDIEELYETWGNDNDEK